jgi:hypothetical protein
MDIVHVQWIDAAGLSEWHGKREFERFCSDESEITESVGMLGFQDDRKIVLIQTAGINQVTGLFEIPKGCIKSIKLLAQIPITLDLQ